MKQIILDYRTNSPIQVSEETYKKIKAILDAEKICQRCQQEYAIDTNPEVAQNLCLCCFLQQPRNTHLEYVGPRTQKTDYSTFHYHTFMDKNGHIWEVSPDWSSSEASENLFVTLGYWDFILPGDDHLLYPSNWSVYGDVRGSVVVGVHSERYNDHKPIAFLLRKNDTPIELNKRKGDIRKLFAEARQRLEVTRDTKGFYHPLSGWKFCHEPEDSNLYEYIVQIESEKVTSSPDPMDKSRGL